MKTSVGLLPVSFLALGLAVTAFYIQGSHAEPVALADFGVTPAAMAEAETPLDETSPPTQDDWLHPAAAQDAKDLCAGSHGVNMVSLNASISLVCNDETVAGFLVSRTGQDTTFVAAPDLSKDDCPDVVEDTEVQPSA